MPTLIDTRGAFRQLREEGGFSEEQADAIVDLFRDADEEVATRSDIERLTDHIDEVEEQTKRELRKELETAEERIKRTLANHIYAAAGVVAAVVTLLNYLMG